MFEERGVRVGAYRRAGRQRDGYGVAEARAWHVTAQPQQAQKLLLRHVRALRHHAVQVQGQHLDVLASQNLHTMVVLVSPCTHGRLLIATWVFNALKKSTTVYF